MTSTITKRLDQFSETAIDDEIVVMNLERGDFFSMTGTGRDIWLLLDQHSSRAELLSELAQAYDQDEAVIAAELGEFIAALNAAGLVDCD